MLLPLLCVLVVTGIFAVIDIRTKQISNNLTFGFMGAGLLFSIGYSVYTLDFSILLNAFAGFILASFLGLYFFFAKAWGGADAKTLMAIGFFLGFRTEMFLFCFVLFFLIYMSTILHKLKFLPKEIALLPFFFFASLTTLAIVV